MGLGHRRQFLLSHGWIQAVAIVMLFGFTVMGMLAYQTYTGEPPIPAPVTDSSGHVLFTRGDILAGQGVFLRNGLMEYGSIFGHGAYLGPDFTADYLHRAALSVMEFYGGESSDHAKAQTVADFKKNRFDSSGDVLTYTPAQIQAYEQLRSHYGEFYWRANDQVWPSAQRHSGPRADSTADRLLQLVGLDLLDAPAWPAIFLHE